MALPMPANCACPRTPVASVASGLSPSYSEPWPAHFYLQKHTTSDRRHECIVTHVHGPQILLCFLSCCILQTNVNTVCTPGYLAITESPAFDVFSGRSVEFSSSEFVKSVVPDGWEVPLAIEVSVDMAVVSCETVVDKMVCIETVLVDETVRVLFVLDKIVVVDETVVQLVLLVELLVFVEVKVCVSVVIDTVELVLVKVVAVDDDTEVLLEVCVVSVDVVIVELLEDCVVLVVEVILLVLLLVVSVVVVDMVAVELLEDFVVLVVEVILLVLLLVVTVVVVDVVHVAVLVVPVVVSWQLPEKKGSVPLTVIFPT